MNNRQLFTEARITRPERLDDIDRGRRTYEATPAFLPLVAFLVALFLVLLSAPLFAQQVDEQAAGGAWSKATACFASEGRRLYATKGATLTEISRGIRYICGSHVHDYCTAFGVLNMVEYRACMTATSVMDQIIAELVELRAND